jgi:hypothetical protein
MKVKGSSAFELTAAVFIALVCLVSLPLQALCLTPIPTPVPGGGDTVLYFDLRRVRVAVSEIAFKNFDTIKTAETIFAQGYRTEIMERRPDIKPYIPSWYPEEDVQVLDIEAKQGELVFGAGGDPNFAGKRLPVGSLKLVFLDHFDADYIAEPLVKTESPNSFTRQYKSSWYSACKHLIETKESPRLFGDLTISDISDYQTVGGFIKVGQLSSSSTAEIYFFRRIRSRGGNGLTCQVALSQATPTPTPTPTKTPLISCTPPPCPYGGKYVCPDYVPDRCVGGCGTICVPPTPVPTATAAYSSPCNSIFCETYSNACSYRYCQLTCPQKCGS